MESNYELIQTLGYLRSCGFLFVLFFVGAASGVAGARLKKSVGVWVFCVSTFLFLGVEVLATGLGLASIDWDILRIFYALSSAVTLLLTIGMLIGVALIKPPPPDRTATEGGT